MKSLFAPSLIKGSLFAILLIYPLLWFALLVNHFIVESRDLANHIPQYLDEDIVILEQFSKPEDVQAFMRNAVLRYRCYTHRPTDNPPHFVEVWDQYGQRIYHDPNKVYPESLLAANLPTPNPLTVGNVNYETARRDGKHWSLRVARPILTLPIVIQRDAFNKSLNLALLFVLPMIMLLIGLAVFQGFRPLSVLVKHLSTREALDCAPLALDVRYRELKPTIAALDALLLRLRTKIRREKNFVQDAAHALQTPMARISAQVATLSNAITSDEKQAALQQIDHALARASRLIHQLLELARIDDSLAHNNQTHDVAKLVQIDLAYLVDIAFIRDIDIALQMPETLIYCLEKNAFQLILHNLVSNAIRFGHEGGLIEVELCSENGHLLLSVADDGPGIPSVDQQRMFERFWRGGEDDAPGSGLGLAIVHQATKRLGASVALESGIGGKGCRFLVRIPPSASSKN